MIEAQPRSKTNLWLSKAIMRIFLRQDIELRLIKRGKQKSSSARSNLDWQITSSYSLWNRSTNDVFVYSLAPLSSITLNYVTNVKFEAVVWDKTTKKLKRLVIFKRNFFSYIYFLAKRKNFQGKKCFVSKIQLSFLKII